MVAGFAILAFALTLAVAGPGMQQGGEPAVFSLAVGSVGLFLTLAGLARPA